MSAAEPSSAPHPACVWLVETWWFGTYEFLGAYNNEAAAREHASDPAVVAKHATSIIIREVGVRTHKSLRVPHQRDIRDRGLKG